ncbi:hypothetical protein Nepgr_026717 [Nepenthes gracilis]|uniref:Kinesin motor domain-containing protein n=1 Tax=Nepenthes gracilis TaxID=150966 RepID=A0AAD3T9J2_NEPGR|nr:hypothetical protein Nepgr_026717 [Nepenthes gracilis]
MEDNRWHDPLLLTDVSRQQNTHLHHIPPTQSNSLPIGMASTASNCKGRSMLGFSLTSPNLVLCTCSPDIPKQNFGDSPEFLKNGESPEETPTPIVLSLEKGINGFETEAFRDTSDNSKFSTFWPTSKAEVLAEASFELAPLSSIGHNFSKETQPIISINAGSEDREVAFGGTKFLKDKCFVGGDVIKTDAYIGDEEGFSLYQTARFGNFSYIFEFLDPGKYIINLHFAEIVFSDGPPGMRVFDVFIQEEKVVSSIDINARVGANRPLVISDLVTAVIDDKRLSIRLEGVIGNPIISGISVRKDLSISAGEVECPKVLGMSQLTDCESAKDNGNHEGFGDFNNLRRHYELQKKELSEARRAVEELKRQNQAKNKECQEAWKSLQELQNELMRKSMHVGSLAFAIEGQVKEKSKWFSTLKDLKRKLKILKLEHIKLSEETLEYKKCLADMDETRYVIQSTVRQQIDMHKEVQEKFIEEAKERKELYNKVLELKGNIRVFCRCRPLNTEEIALGASMVINFDAATEGELTVRSNGWPRKTFKFDAVFGPEADQADVSEDTAPFATSVLDGYNVCIFAYGQTGTGKTFTMEGTEEARGVNYRTLEELFNIIGGREKLFRYEISVSALEVYNEQIRDLLASGTQPGVSSKRLEIRQASEGVHHVPGLVEAHVSNMSEVWDVLQTGSNARAVGSTNANEHSSRSHCIHCVMVKGENLLNGECTRSKLWLVDLAGSERISKTEAQGERLKEAQNINRSLSALGDVIAALATKSPHIPFRNSKLTHLLQDSLGGHSKALMFVQISPNEKDLSETLCSLNFASRVKGIELGPAKKQLENNESLKHKQMVEKIKQEMKCRDMQIKKMEDHINNLEMKVKEKDLKNKNLQDKLKELESQLLIERKLARQHVDNRIAEQQQQQQIRQQLEEQNIASIRSPLAAVPLTNVKNNTHDPAINTLNVLHTIVDYKHHPHKAQSLSSQADIFDMHNAPDEKENNPEIAEQLQTKIITGDASVCPTARRIPLASSAPRRNSFIPTARGVPMATADPRRNSLIPLPCAPSTVQLPPSSFPLPPSRVDKIEDGGDGVEINCLPLSTSSPRVKSEGKKSNCIFRRSLQKRVQIKSPLQQQLKKAGLSIGMQKVRVSIGSRGRMAQRAVLGNRRRAGTAEVQSRHSKKDKERGWNI